MDRPVPIRNRHGARDLLRVFVALACLAFSSTLHADFRLVEQTVDTPERGKVMSYLLMTDSNRFAFFPPPGWKLKLIANERKAIFSATNLTTSASVVISDPLPKGFDATRTNAWQELILQRYPDTQLLSVFSFPSGAGDGKAFDLKGVAANNTYFLTRVVLVPVQGALLDFNLTCPPTAFDNAVQIFGRFVTSFHVGSLEPPERKNPSGTRPRSPNYTD